MIMGVSFGRGVFFHNRRVLACAEVKRGVIHVWAEPITPKTLGKIWWRVLLSLPWPYQLFHLAVLLYLFFPVYGELNPLWLVLYAAGFHFIFPRRLKQFHGAEHKVFSYNGTKRLEAIQEIKQASIVNSGCSTNYVTYFFVSFLLALLFLPLGWSVLCGALGVVAGSLGQTYRPGWMKPFFRLSGFLQRHVTTMEPDQIHLETAIRSYQMFEHYRGKSA
ncbi:DUF1385 domain-containing protein [Brevibacillus massiliensis]|uniref:DUF1385 domain-containing protein n=1 Tax=Brevibacillus massiliensis TaxID=1118054 RepID=UPI0002DB6F44